MSPHAQQALARSLRAPITRARRVVLFVIVCLIVVAEPAAALTCQSPDAWYTETLSLTGSPDLPAGVTIRATEPRQVDEEVVLNGIEISNTSATPLYLLVSESEFKSFYQWSSFAWSNDYDGTPLPQGSRTERKAFNGKAYHWRTNCTIKNCGILTWDAAEDRFTVTGGRAGISPGFEARNIREPGRAIDAAIPSPQPGTITLLYGDRTVVVPFLVTYAINTRYDPTKVLRCPDLSGVMIAFGVAVLVLLLLALATLFVLFRLARHLYRAVRTPTST
jgi:hypothetical protein